MSCIAVERGGEPVTPSGNRGDRLRSQQLAQGADLHLHVVLLDHQPRPHQVEQFGLGDEPVAPLDQRQQHIEGARTNARGATLDQQLPLAGPHFDSAKT